MEHHFSDGGKTNKVRKDLEGQGSLKRKQGQTPRCQMLLLFPAETNYHSAHPNCPFHLEDLNVNISPPLVTMCSPESVQHRRDEQLSVERTFVGQDPGSSQAPGDAAVKESYWPPAGKWLKTSPRGQTAALENLKSPAVCRLADSGFSYAWLGYSLSDDAFPCRNHCRH